METKKSKQPEKGAPLAASPESKTIRTGRGRLVKQYPANPGFHGSDNEKKLNPEE